jgi:squalene-hopene/tetraprenyl-beta-curcumene cyclase
MKHALTIRIALLLSPLAPLHAADAPAVPKKAEPAATAEAPPKRWAEEPFLPRFSAAKAAEFLDAGARANEGNKCLNCHASFAYLMARPALPIQTARHAEVRSAVEEWVGHLESLSLGVESDSRRRAEAVMAGAVLAGHDAATTGNLQPVSRRALDLMWRVQLPDGGFDWLKPNNEPPSAIDNHFGATMAALGAGVAPDGYSKTPAAHAGLERLRDWLRTHPPQHIHQRGMLLVADHWVGGLMDEAVRKQAVADMFAIQRPDGGWAMAALGDSTWKRKDQTPQDLTTSDGYGTGFCVYVLRLAGKVPADDPRIRKAVAWLLEHQRESGYWYARSPKGNDRLSTFVGTAYAVLALKQCGEIP